MKICQALAKLGHDVRLLALDAPDRAEQGIDDVFSYYGVEEMFSCRRKPFPRMPGRQWIYAAAMVPEIRRWQPDLIYCRYFPAAVMASLLGRPFAYESHERIWDRGRVARILARRVFASRAFTKLVVISDALKRMYLQEKLVDEARVLVAHDAAEEPGIEEAPSGESGGGTFKAGYIGGIYEGRGLELLIACADRLPDVEFHFVGGTETELRTLVNRELPGNVRCHGYVPPNDVPRLQRGFDVLLAPYQQRVAVWGGKGDTSTFMSPLKIFESMAAQRPMICSDLPVLREVVNEKNACLAQPDDVEGWVSALEELRDDPLLRKRLADRACRDFRENYTWETRARGIVQSLDSGGEFSQAGRDD